MEGLGLATKLGITIVVLILAGLGAGLGLDKMLGTSPIFVLVGAVVSIIFSVIALFQMTRDYREPLRKKKTPVQPK